MKKIEGITVTLYERKKVGEDILHSPIYEDTETEVPNVLVSPVTAEDLADTLTLTGRHAVYELAIPKGDAHTWENCRIRFFGEDWKAVTPAVGGIEENIPLSWNRKIKVERYESN